MPAGQYSLPFADHNHDPTIVACPDGSLLAAWYSTNCGEAGRCVGLVSARLEQGADAWTNATVDMDVADRTQCCPAFFLDQVRGLLYQFSSMGGAGDMVSLIGVVRVSSDCGRSWWQNANASAAVAMAPLAGSATNASGGGAGAATIIWPAHGIMHQVVVTVVQRPDTGQLIVPVDHWGIAPCVVAVVTAVVDVVVIVVVAAGGARGSAVRFESSDTALDYATLRGQDRVGTSAVLSTWFSTCPSPVSNVWRVDHHR
jgi:hypothetical protein